MAVPSSAVVLGRLPLLLRLPGQDPHLRQLQACAQEDASTSSTEVEHKPASLAHSMPVASQHIMTGLSRKQPEPDDGMIEKASQVLCAYEVREAISTRCPQGPAVH